LVVLILVEIVIVEIHFGCLSLIGIIKYEMFNIRVLGGDVKPINSYFFGINSDSSMFIFFGMWTVITSLDAVATY
jgi:hypothetical protein